MSASSGQPIIDERPLTSEERALAAAMLQAAGPSAQSYLAQLARARVVSRCPCGCASVDFDVDGEPRPEGGLDILGDYWYGDEAQLAGAFIFARRGVLAGIEVWSPVGADAPRTLPHPDELRPAPG